jgi:hypothetical protein
MLRAMAFPRTNTIVLLLVLLPACGEGGAAPSYDVTVSFDADYTEAAGTAVADAVHALDDDADVRLQESFPPVAAATIRSRREDVCEELLRRLRDQPAVAGIRCEPTGAPTR